MSIYDLDSNKYKYILELADNMASNAGFLTSQHYSEFINARDKLILELARLFPNKQEST
jgi:hypothetical protein